MASWPDIASWVVQPNYEGRNITPLAERTGRDLPVSKPDPAAIMIHDSMMRRAYGIFFRVQGVTDEVTHDMLTHPINYDN